jgi:putative selenium metabolism protein SsnA
VTSLFPPEVVDGDVVVIGDRIGRVGPPETGDDAPPHGASMLDCTGCLVIPGNVCAHTHVYSALARGMPYRLAPPTDFVEILRRVWWRLDRALDEESIRASARVAAIEAVLAGTTTLVDHHASPSAVDGSLDILAEELARVGIRSILAYETSDRDGPEVASAGLAENARFLARVATTRPALVRGNVGAHASFTLSETTLAACVDLARATGRGLHVHVAEDAADERDAEATYGLRVLQRLDHAGALDPAPILAHGVHLDRDEARLLRASGATLVHNPRSNMNNRVGRAPLATLGERVALGTDGIGADMFTESVVGYLRHVEGRRDADAPPAESPLDAGSADPAWPLARLAQGARLVADAFDEPDLGRVVPGAPADLVVLDYGAPTPVTAATLAGHWTFGISSRAVRDVLVGGRTVVRDRRVVTVDQDAVAAEGRRAATRLWERLDLLPEHPFEPRLAVPR